MNEKDLLEQIKQSAGQVTPPDTLSPDAIEKMLRQSAAPKETGNACDGTSDAADHTPPEKRTDPTTAAKKRKRKTAIYRLGQLAAVFALVLVGVWQTNRLGLFRFDKTSDEAVIFNDDKAAAPEAAENMEEIVITESDSVPLAALEGADSYETIYQALYDAFGNGRDYGIVYDEDIAMEEDSVMEAAQDTAATSSVSPLAAAGSSAKSAASDSYSETNVQEIGVDEGDFVKTDGSYLYILKTDGSLFIVSADEGDMEIVSSIRLPIRETVKELYVDKNVLSVVTSGYFTELDTSSDSVYSSVSRYRTSLHTYDITDRKNPRQTGTVTQDGNFSQSRKNGDFIYLFTQYSPDIRDTYQESQIIPKTSRGDLTASEIYLPENLNYSTYLVASSVNIHDPGTIVDQKAVVSVADTFYASPENIYIANQNWNGSDTRTELIKLHYQDGSIVGTAAGSVEGYLNNSFSMNEYNGYLRVVTTSYDENYDERNGLYILDQELNLTGAIRDLAPGETIRSARFFGDTGYFVTFRQTDPLFSADLTDPENPRILGELKISGFSSYLHFYSEDLLLGMGYEADEETGTRTGLKLSMFDISDPSDVKEVCKLVLQGITWCNSLDDYKSILMDPEKNLFGFACDNRYLLFSYDEEKGFVKEFIYDFYNDMIYESMAGPQENETSEETEETFNMADYFGYSSYTSDDDVTRGLYINDTLYLVRPNAVTAFDMKDDYKEIGRILLR